MDDPDCRLVGEWRPLRGGDESSAIRRFHAARPGGAAMLVCPGGGYARLAEHEGAPVCRWLNSFGIDAFELRYRVATAAGFPAPLEDAVAGINAIHGCAGAGGIDPSRIGAIGFSAGGHLAGLLSTRRDDDGAGLCPPLAAVVLVYPVVSMFSPFAHEGSVANLLGVRPTDPARRATSLQLRISPATPPTWIVHSLDDGSVPVENSLAYAAALRTAGRNVELHLFDADAGHGFGLARGDRHHPRLRAWPALCADWLASLGFINSESGAFS